MWQDTNAHIRGDCAKQYKHIRKLLRDDNSDPIYQDCINFWPWVILITVFLTVVLLAQGCSIASDGILGLKKPIVEYSNIEYVNAIYMAEGGVNAKYLYGIRSIRYTSKEDAKKLCFNTVKNNEKRYKKYGYRKYSSFIQFLANRYCPTTGRNLTQSERKLNRYWMSNVTWFLEHNRKRG